MAKRAVLLALTLFLLTSAFTQQPASLGPKMETIDGKKEPGRIPDNSAFRLWFVVASTSSNPSPEELVRQTAQFNKVGFSDEEKAIATSVLRSFRDEYDQMIERNNSSISGETKMTQEELDAQIAAFMRLRDELVSRTRDQLRRALGGPGWSKLNRVIQSEKTHMTVTIPKQ